MFDVITIVMLVSIAVIFAYLTFAMIREQERNWKNRNNG